MFFFKKSKNNNKKTKEVDYGDNAGEKNWMSKRKLRNYVERNKEEEEAVLVKVVVVVEMMKTSISLLCAFPC